MTKFDIIIIGSGLTSVSALKSLPKNNQIAIISGENSSSTNCNKGVHPKILANSFETDEPIGLTDPIPINGFKNMPTDAKVPKEMALRKKATATTIQPYPGVSENLALDIRLKNFQEFRDDQFIT